MKLKHLLIFVLAQCGSVANANTSIAAENLNSISDSYSEVQSYLYLGTTSSHNSPVNLFTLTQTKPNSLLVVAIKNGNYIYDKIFRMAKSDYSVSVLKEQRGSHQEELRKRLTHMVSMFGSILI